MEVKGGGQAGFVVLRWRRQAVRTGGRDRRSGQAVKTGAQTQARRRSAGVYLGHSGVLDADGRVLNPLESKQLHNVHGLLRAGQRTRQSLSG